MILIEKIVVGGIGAGIALLLRELVEEYKKWQRRQRLASLAVTHLRQIRQDLKKHVKVQDGKAVFQETQYWEIVVGDFLYELFTTNVDAFPTISSLEATMEFFHHYKVNMATVRARLDSSGNQAAQLTEATYQNLLDRLDKALSELTQLSGT